MMEMIYSAKRPDAPIILSDGEYKGLHYYVLSLGTHPCAYVDVAGTALQGKHYDGIDIECHGGLTYSRKYLSSVDKTGWFIGWDYAHWGDYAGYLMNYPESMGNNGKKWTTDEIVRECRDVIDQMYAKGYLEDT